MNLEESRRRAQDNPADTEAWARYLIASQAAGSDEAARALSEGDAARRWEVLRAAAAPAHREQLAPLAQAWWAEASERDRAPYQAVWAALLGIPAERRVELRPGTFLDMVLIPPGRFRMGAGFRPPTPEQLGDVSHLDDKSDLDPDEWYGPSELQLHTWDAQKRYGEDPQSTEAPPHDVTVARPFYMARCITTRAQFEAVWPNWWRGEIHDYVPEQPAQSKNWLGTLGWIGTLNTADLPLRLRLPTEAEWEYACRAGSTDRFCFGMDLRGLPAYAWTGESPAKPDRDPHKRWTDRMRELFGSKPNWIWWSAPVGLLAPNAWGLYDMHGNAYELCEDAWHPSYEGAPSDGSAWDPPPAALDRAALGEVYQSFKVPGSDALERFEQLIKQVGVSHYAKRVARGGAFNSSGTDTRSAARQIHDACSGDLSFRLCADVPDAPTP